MPRCRAGEGLPTGAAAALLDHLLRTPHFLCGQFIAGINFNRLLEECQCIRQISLVTQLLPPFDLGSGSQHARPLIRQAISQVVRFLLIGRFVEFKSCLVVLPRLCFDPFVMERLGGIRGGQKCRKKKHHCEGCCNLPHTLLLYSWALPKSLFFREMVGGTYPLSHPALDFSEARLYTCSGAQHRTTLVTKFALW